MERSKTDRELVSIYRAARRLGLAPRRLRQAVRAGKLPAYRPGDRTVYIRWPELLDWLGTQRVPPPGHIPSVRNTVVAEAIKTEDDR